MPLENEQTASAPVSAEPASAVAGRSGSPAPSESAYKPELVLGFVAPTGISSEAVQALVAERLSAYGYEIEEIRLSSWLADLAGVKGEERPDIKIPAQQKAGDLVRSMSGRPEAMAFVAIREITRSREAWNKKAGKSTSTESVASATDGRIVEETPPVPKRAYVVWSLKQRDEVELLRQIYRSRFFLFSVYAPEETRRIALARTIKAGLKTTKDYKAFFPCAEEIIRTDEHEVLETGNFGQDVRNAYPEADFFVDGSNSDDLEKSIRRSVDIIFGTPFATPTKDEYAMYVAHAASLRSAEMGRQVGACIATELGDVVATGTNEVPIFGGGHYWIDPSEPNSKMDNREYTRGQDTSDLTKQLLANEIFARLKYTRDIPSDAHPSSEAVYNALAATGLGEITEFGRAVHAEMSALMDAARRGVAVSGLTMHVTTFPCHQCSRHIVAAGLRRLVYIFPYAKSRADELHGDSIETPESPKVDRERVRYKNYLGVAPRLYPLAFTMTLRKDPAGKAKPRVDRNRIPRLPDEGPNGIWDVLGYLDREQKAISESRLWLLAVEADVTKAMKK